ncbi:MAG TPA: YSC84-related protein [Verrucomicrobiae bacterium]|nr:YSC84-related protein [Verrucomicrobiae bacterium]
MKTRRITGLIATLTLAAAVVAAAAEADRLSTDVRDTIQMYRSHSADMQQLFDTAYGYAVFPSVGKGAIGIGGAEGRGQVFEKGALIGTVKLTQASAGAQLGAQSYSEVIFFETPKAFDDFRDGKTAFSAGLSAALAAKGGGGEAKYQGGVLVHTMARSGLMFEASIGGQHFKFTALGESSPAPAPAATQAPPAGSAAPPVAPSTPTE